MSAVQPEQRETYVIRAMTQDDLPAACALWSTTAGVELAEGDSLPELAVYLQRNPGASHVAVWKGTVIGAMLAGHDGRRGFVYHLAVEREHRGQRLGRDLVAQSLSVLKRQGIRRVLGLVDRENPEGRAFWVHEGWEPLAFAEAIGIDV